MPAGPGSPPSRTSSVVEDALHPERHGEHVEPPEDETVVSGPAEIGSRNGEAEVGEA
jgi:hypothetical protein